MESISILRKIDDYVLGPMLGKGFFGHVRAAKKIDGPDSAFAIKYMKVGKPNSKESLAKSLEQEAILMKLSHPNILRIYEVNSEGVYEKNNENTSKIPVVYAVMQLARSGDLFDFVISSGGLSENIARFYFYQILNAVEYLHSLGLAHRDIKPENVLLDQNYNAVLTDFGLCTKFSELGFLTSNPIHKVGTERCMSPELFAGVIHSPFKDDLFALGYLLFMIVSRHPPFLAASPTNEHYRLLKENHVLEYWKAIDSLHHPKWCSDEFKHFMTLMLAYDMTIRPSISEMRAHPWMKGPIPTEAEVIAEFDKRQVFALEYQKNEAKKRKQRKEEQKKDVAQEKQRKCFGPRRLKRSVVPKNQTVSRAAATKTIKEFGDYREHKPTILMSQEDAQDIENTLTSFFVSADSIKLNKEKYKVNNLLIVD